jgi:hypothetical protein
MVQTQQHTQRVTTQIRESSQYHPAAPAKILETNEIHLLAALLPICTGRLKIMQQSKSTEAVASYLPP